MERILRSSYEGSKLSSDDACQFFFPCSTAHVIMLVFITISVCFGLLQLAILSKKSFTYSKIMQGIMIAEMASIFSISWFIANILNHNVKENFTAFTKYILLMFLNDQVALENTIDKINYTLFHTFQIFAFQMNTFLCLEMILTLKDPVSKIEKRVFIYSLLSYLLFFVSFFFLLLLDHDYKNAAFIGEIIFTKEINHIVDGGFRVIKLLHYCSFLLVGVLSILYIITRFRKTVKIAKSLRIKFVVKHVLYVVVYALFTFPYMCYELDFFLNYETFSLSEYLYIDISFVLFSMLPFAMFFIRSSEMNFLEEVKTWFSENVCKYKGRAERDTTASYLSSDEHLKYKNAFFDPSQELTKTIFESINYEFLQCILSGLKQIVEKVEDKERKRAEKSKLTSTLCDASLSITSKTIRKKKLSLFKDTSKDIEYGNLATVEHKILYKKPSLEDAVDESSSPEPRPLAIRIQTSSQSASVSSDIQRTNSNASASVATDKKNETLGENESIGVMKEYCPKVFNELRKLDGVTAEIIANSLDIAKNKDNMKKLKQSDGKSGSFMFFSYDSKFIIKTLYPHELKVLTNGFLKSYHELLVESNSSSLLARIYGVYEIIIEGVSKISIILMQNLKIFPPSSIKYTFDLKGSELGRFTKLAKLPPEERRTAILKDINFKIMKELDRHLIDITSDKIKFFLDTLKKDATILQINELMDYSLLLFIVEVPKDTESLEYQKVWDCFGEMRYHSKLIKSKNQDYIYCLGIIDYLQVFNLKKFLENKYKSLLYGKKINLISAVDPVMYSDRFINFTQEFVLRAEK